MSRFGTIGVFGAGAWGTALAAAAARAGRQVTFVARDPVAAREMESARENVARLPGLILDPLIRPTASLAALADAEAVLVAVPAQAMQGACMALAPVLSSGIPVIACAKGIERGTRRFMTDVIADALPGAIPAILSGPSFAADVAAGLPTAIVVACQRPGLAADMAEALTSPRLRLYHGIDTRGVEIGGAAKNVLAIAAGIVEGRGLGDSAKAALTARGFAELRRFAAAHGAKPETLMGLSGLGDLLLSTSTPKSRNFAYGLALGRGEPPGSAAHGKLAEGVFTASVLVAMAHARGVAVPVCEAVAAIVEESLSIDMAITALMDRPVKPEG